MLSLGFKQVSAESCLFVFHHPKHGRIICSNYVDDLICLTGSRVLRDWWRKALTDHFLRVTFNDKLDFILGIKIDQGVNSEGRRYLELNHNLAIEKVATAAGIGDGARKVTSPMDHSTKLRKKRDGEAQVHVCSAIFTCTTCMRQTRTGRREGQTEGGEENDDVPVYTS